MVLVQALDEVVPPELPPLLKVKVVLVTIVIIMIMVKVTSYYPGSPPPGPPVCEVRSVLAAVLLLMRVLPLRDTASFSHTPAHMAGCYKWAAYYSLLQSWGRRTVYETYSELGGPLRRLLPTLVT